MTLNKIIIINSNLGNFAFVKDGKYNLLSQSLGEKNQIDFSNNFDSWDMVDFLSNLDNGYKEIIELAIKELN